MSGFINGLFSYETLFDLADKKNRSASIETQMAQPGFWDDQPTALGVVAELKSLKAILKPIEEVGRLADDLSALAEMAKKLDLSSENRNVKIHFESPSETVFAFLKEIWQAEKKKRAQATAQ